MSLNMNSNLMYFPFKSDPRHCIRPICTQNGLRNWLFFFRNYVCIYLAYVNQAYVYPTCFSLIIDINCLILSFAVHCTGKNN